MVRAQTHKPGVGGSNPPLPTKFMQNISIYCLTMDPSHESKILNLNFIPVGLGEEKFSNNFNR